ncbi:hypothetical protein D3C75_976230 [compost metagenome]
MTQEFQGRQLLEQGAVVVRHLDILTRFEQPLRIIADTAPGRGKQRWRITLVIGASNEEVEHCEPGFIDA